MVVIEPQYSKVEGGHPVSPQVAMLRAHLVQKWFGHSDPAMKEALQKNMLH